MNGYYNPIQQTAPLGTRCNATVLSNIS